LHGDFRRSGATLKGFRPDLRRLLAVDIADEHPRTLSGEAVDNAPPDVGSPAGDEDAGSVQVQIHPCSSAGACRG